MNWHFYKKIILADSTRYGIHKNEIYRFLIKSIEFRFVFIFRTVAFLKTQPLLFPLFVIMRFIYGRMKIRYGINIPYNTGIGPGLYIGHFGGIVIHPEVKIGKNCNLNHCITIGVAYGGKNPGVPKLGDNVYLGPGCKIFGGITIGNDVAIGANCVVTKSIPDRSVVVGIPGRIISYKGSGAYVVNKWIEN